MRTEQNIQDSIYHWKCTQGIVCPNIYLYDWESDIIFLNKNNFVTEYEIKLSRLDFRNDKKKENKFFKLTNGIRPPGEAGWPNTIKGNHLAERPNYFYYICPVDVISINEVPEFAGLIYFKKEYYGRQIIKKAKRLHKNLISGRALKRLSNSFYFKYWSMRQSLTPNPKQL